MSSFLSSLAKAYYEAEGSNLSRFCFVFPNKRAGTFFTRHLSHIADKPLLTPQVMTLSELTERLSQFSPASEYECIFTLYTSYCKLEPEAPEFDRFRQWGQVLLNDFNDVDRNLADPEMVFRNVKRYREISSDYLTEEQREIISRYWGDDVLVDTHSAAEESNNFWRHNVRENKGATEKFVKLWEVLWPLYRDLRDSLAKRGLGTYGMICRDAARQVSGGESLPDFKRYVFAGFDNLSLSELKMLEGLQKNVGADWQWDIPAAIMQISPRQAGRYVSALAEKFPSRFIFPSEETLPETVVMGISSNIGQSREAGSQIQEWIDDGAIQNPSDAINTAMVLPDTGLFIPAIHAIPQKISCLNVTMGLPMRQTPVSAFLQMILLLQMKARKSHGVHCFYYEDVKGLLTSPLCRERAEESSNHLLLKIATKRMYTIPETEFADVPGLAMLFRYIGEDTPIENVREYVFGVLDFLTITPEGAKPDKMSELVIRAYRDGVNELYFAVREHDIAMRGTTFLRMVQSTLASSSIPLSGQPLRGLQMMGVLETRTLGFENLIFLSMNERVFPRKQYSRSIIPDIIRRAYSLTTPERNDASYAYHFFRLYGHAKRVLLTYDNRSTGAKNPEMSRFLYQIMYAQFAKTLPVHKVSRFPIAPQTERVLQINKNARVMEKLECYTRQGEGKKHLSASAINHYIECPLKFYLSEVEGLSIDNEVTDYVDAGLFGTIVHQVFENLYVGLRGNRPELEVTTRLIDDILRDKPIRIERLVTQAINQHYNNLNGDDLNRPLSGAVTLLANVITDLVARTLEEEKQFTPFTFIGAEEKQDVVWEIKPGLRLNFRMLIDRVDRVDGHIRLVDYKTGSDATSFSEVNHLFDSTRGRNRQKAILQLLLYANLYAKIKNTDERIEVIIYGLRQVFNRGLEQIKYTKEVLSDYHTVNEEYLEKLTEVISEIFNPDVPFAQGCHNDACTFCRFKDICKQ